MLTRGDLFRVLDAAFERAAETYVILDGDFLHPDGPMVLYANRASMEEGGRKAAEMIGIRLYTLYPGEARKMAVQQIERAAEAKRPIPVESGFKTGTKNEMIWIEINTIPILDDKGDISNFVSIGRNITARKRAEQSREATQRLLASVFGVIGQAIAVVDEEARLTIINTALTRQFGWSVFEVSGKNLDVIVVDLKTSDVWGKITGTESGTSYITASLRHKDGRIIPGEIVSATIEQADHRRYFVLNFVAAKPAASSPEDSPIGVAIRRLLDRPGQTSILVAGKLQLIGLAEIKEKFKARWPEVSQRVFLTAEKILRNHLDDLDVFERTHDDGFVICFSKLTEDEAKFKAHAIGTEIRERLIGEVVEVSELKIETFAAAVPIQPSGHGGWGNIQETLEKSLADGRAAVEKTALNQLEIYFSNGVTLFQSVRSETNQSAHLLYGYLPVPVESCLATLEGLGQHDHRVRAEMVLLSNAAKHALSKSNHEKPEPIFVPVQLATLVNRRTSELFVNFARTLFDAVQQRIIIEITEIARDTAGLRLGDLAFALSSMFRLVAFELPNLDPSFISRLPPSAQIVTISTKNLGPHGGAPQAEATAKLIKLATDRRLRLVFKDISGPSQAMFLARAGAKLLLTKP